MNVSGLLGEEAEDHYLVLEQARAVATDVLLATRDGLADVIEARAMMCVHGDAGLGKTLSVNASLRDLAPHNTCRVQFRSRPTPRDIRHELFRALQISGNPPSKPIEFDAILKDTLAAKFRVLVCDEAQWCPGSALSTGATCGTTGTPTLLWSSSAEATAIGSYAANPFCPPVCICSRSSSGSPRLRSKR